jgi:hypothetical protein
MKQWITPAMILALATFLVIPATTQSLAIPLSGAGLSVGAPAKEGDGIVFLAATARHSSAAAIKTCQRIHNRNQRQRCLGNMR